MPLKRGRVIGYDANRMAFEFTMIDRAIVAIIECEIRSTAMDHLAGIRGTMPAEREAQCLHLRDTIERIASDLFEEGSARPIGLIRIFAQHGKRRESSWLLVAILNP